MTDALVMANVHKVFVILYKETNNTIFIFVDTNKAHRLIFCKHSNTIQLHFFIHIILIKFDNTQESIYFRNVFSQNTNLNGKVIYN